MVGEPVGEHDRAGLPGRRPRRSPSGPTPTVSRHGRRPGGRRGSRPARPTAGTARAADRRGRRRRARRFRRRRPRAGRPGRRWPRRRRARPSRAASGATPRSGPLARDERDRRERQRLGDAGDAAHPSERHTADERCGEVVGVALELEAAASSASGSPSGPRRRDAERDRGRGRAEAALERNPVDEAEALAGGVGEQRIGAHREVRVSAGNSPAPSPSTTTPSPSTPRARSTTRGRPRRSRRPARGWPTSRGPGTSARPGALLGARCAGDRVGIGSTTEGVGANRSAAAGSFRPWPVIVTTMRSPSRRRGGPRRAPRRTTARRRAPRRTRGAARRRRAPRPSPRRPRARRAHGRRVHRVADPDRGREPSPTVDRLDGHERRHEPELGERLPVRRRVAPRLRREREGVRRAAELLRPRSRRLLAGAPVRVERVDERVRAPPAELLCRREGFVEVAASTVAPSIRVCASFAELAPCGVSTSAGSPRASRRQPRAAVFPVEAQMTAARRRPRAPWRRRRSCRGRCTTPSGWTPPI